MHAIWGATADSSTVEEQVAAPFFTLVLTWQGPVTLAAAVVGLIATLAALRRPHSDLAWFTRWTDAKEHAESPEAKDFIERQIQHYIFEFAVSDTSRKARQRVVLAGIGMTLIGVVGFAIAANAASDVRQRIAALDSERDRAVVALLGFDVELTLPTTLPTIRPTTLPWRSLPTTTGIPTATVDAAPSSAPSAEPAPTGSATPIAIDVLRRNLATLFGSRDTQYRSLEEYAETIEALQTDAEDLEAISMWATMLYASGIVVFVTVPGRIRKKARAELRASGWGAGPPEDVPADEPDDGVP